MSISALQWGVMIYSWCISWKHETDDGNIKDEKERKKRLDGNLIFDQTSLQLQSTMIDTKNSSFLGACLEEDFRRAMVQPGQPSW